MRQVVVLVLLALVGAVSAAVALAGSAPPGATAQCRDGSYSYSQHHSGTCSHHGGVAVWLDGSSASSSAPSSSTGSTSSSSKPTGSASVNLGKTVLLKRQTKTSGCKLGALPDRHCSPGAYYTGLTKRVICSPSFRTRSVRHVTDGEKHQVEIEYGLAPKRYGRTLEIDHIVSLELGGSNDAANLFPEEATLPGGAPGYHAKDRLENKAHAFVCAGEMTLRAARQQIASNWERLYKKVFGVAPTG